MRSVASQDRRDASRLFGLFQQPLHRRLATSGGDSVRFPGTRPENYNSAKIFHGPGLDGVYDWWVVRMEFVNHRNQNRCRLFAGLVCLLAVVFLYTPFAAAAWSSQACCTGGLCNIPKHHHQKAPANSTDCDHHGRDMSGMTNCSMSCCQDPDKPVVTSMAFVLPPASSTLSTTIDTRSIERVRPIEIPRTIEPLSPPPRTDDAAL